MPDGSGFQATRDIRKARAGIPVIMVSSKNRAPDTLMAKNSGAVDYVFKPVEASDLLDKIKKHIG
jgi:twitching motility two-component system response regulator PilH